MELHFEWADVQRAIAQTKAATEHQCAFGQEKAGPDLWLVGDSGIYLMPNARLKDGEKPVVVYARECNPDKMPFDLWWANKQASWGGDDGCEVVSVADIERMALASPGPDWKIGRVVVEMSPESFSLSLEWERPKKPKPKPGETVH